MKRVLSVLLVWVTILCCTVPAFARSSDARLTFDANGDFTILHLTDWHTAYPLPDLQKQLVLESLAAADPDLVVLGGDLSEASTEDQHAALREICALFVNAEIPFVITFGNHDYMHGYTIDEMFAFYKEYGGEYFVGTDEVPDLFGCGTCSIPVSSHDGSRTAYNIYARLYCVSRHRRDERVHLP